MCERSVSVVESSTSLAVLQINENNYLEVLIVWSWLRVGLKLSLRPTKSCVDSLSMELAPKWLGSIVKAVKISS